MEQNNDVVRLCKIVDIEEKLQSKGIECTDMTEVAFSLASAMSEPLAQHEKRKAETAAALQAAQRKHQELDAKMKELEGQIAELSAKEAVQSEGVSGLQKNLAEIDAKPWYWLGIIIFRWLYMIFKGRAWRAERAEAAAKLDDAVRILKDQRDRLSSFNQSHTDTSEEATLLQDNTIAPLQRETEALSKVPRVVEGLGALAFPVVPITMQRFRERKKRVTPQVSMYLGGIERGDARRLAIPKVERATDPRFHTEMEETLEVIDAYDSESPMLGAFDSEREEFGDVSTLVGVEGHLVKAISFLNEIGATCKTEHLELPFVPTSSPASALLADGFDAVANRSSEEVFDRSTARKVEELTGLVRSAEALLEMSESVGDAIQEVVERLERGLREKHDRAYTNQDRGTKESVLAITRAEANAKLVRYNYYCPLCNVSPSFIKHRYGLDLGRIGEFSAQPTPTVRACLDRYQTQMFDVLKERQGVTVIDVDRIRESWTLAYERLFQIEKDVREDEAELSEAEQGASSSNREQLKVKRRSIRSKRALYRQIVMALLHDPYHEFVDPFTNQGTADTSWRTSNGSERFNEGTHLFYDLVDVRDMIETQNDAKPWTCGACKQSFTQEEAMMGAVDRVKYSIITPLISTLWHSDQVWSKSVDLLSSTSREIRDRLVEETQSLQAPIDQFLADSRQLRSQLQEHYAKSLSSSDRMRQLGDDFEALNLLKPEQKEKIITSVQEGADKRRNIDEKIAEMDHLENRLQRIPSELFIDRPTPGLPGEEIVRELLEEGVFLQGQTTQAPFPSGISDNGAAS